MGVGKIPLIAHGFKTNMHPRTEVRIPTSDQAVQDLIYEEVCFSRAS